MALLLPLGFVAALAFRPLPGPKATQPVYAPSAQFPNILDVVNEGPVTARLLTEEAGPLRMLELELAESLPLASGQVMLSQEGQGDRFLGSLKAAGVYRFALDSLSSDQAEYELVLLDGLHQSPFQTISLRP